MFIERKGKDREPEREYISNFTLQPSYSLEIDNKDMHQTFFVFDVYVVTKPHKRYQVKLTAADFESMKELQARLKEQVSQAGCMLHDAQNHMRGIAHRYVTLGMSDQSMVKRGTSVLGYERLEDDGEKYFCSTNGLVYNSIGEPSEQLMYIGADVPSTDMALLESLTNLDYNKDEWEKVIMPFFLRSIMKLHTKDNMLLTAGWIGSLTHEYNIRRVFNAYPILHIAGKQGAGKSTIVQALRKYIGYKSDAVPTFPSPPALTKAATMGYTIPLTLDEYGGSDGNFGWSRERYNQTHLVMKEIYAKSIVSKLGRGEGGQGSFSYKMRSSLITLGQSFLADPSIASRSAQIHVYNAFHHTEEGRRAKNVAEQMRNATNTNFWAGYNIWCMRQEDHKVQEVARSYASGISSDMSSRQKDVAATIMTGLHYLLKLANEFGISTNDLGFDEEDIKRVPDIMRENDSVANGGDQEANILYEFLRDMGNDAYTVGNTPQGGQIYGSGQNVCIYTPATSDAGKYGNDNKPACVYGKELILIDIDAMCKHLNRKLGTNRYTKKDMNVYIQSEFQKSMLDSTGLVLAPSGYRVKQGKITKRYSAFCRTTLEEMVPEFGILDTN